MEYPILPKTVGLIETLSAWSNAPRMVVLATKTSREPSRGCRMKNPMEYPILPEKKEWKGCSMEHPTKYRMGY